MLEKEKIINRISAMSMFEACSPDFIEKIAAQSRIHSVPKGKILYLKHDPANQFFIVIKGWVKLMHETLDGTQAVIDILPEGHVFGETSIFEGDRYSCSAEAVEHLDYISLPLTALKQEIEGNPKFAMGMLSSMARYRKQQDQEIEHRTLQNAPQRIGCFLLRLADQTSEGNVTIQLPYDKTLVASRLGMQPETFSRALSKLKEATGIQVKGATIEVEDLMQLSEYSCAACSSEFPCKDLRGQKENCS